jgi:transcriptional regulator with XRE-family HTH domain
MSEIMIETPQEWSLQRALSVHRKIRGLTQLQLAQKSGYSLATIFRLEHGMMNPTLECLQDVLGALGVELVLGVRVKEA